MLLKSTDSLLFVIDIQEKLFPLQDEKEKFLKGARFLIEVARILSVPILLSEQYPKGLGATIPEIKDYGIQVFEKLTFSCAEDVAIRKILENYNRSQIILIGMEAHICVLQTAFGLKSLGFNPYVVANAISAREKFDKEMALKRMQCQGINCVTKEMVCYEWLYQSGTEEFKKINKIIKDQ